MDGWRWRGGVAACFLAFLVQAGFSRPEVFFQKGVNFTAEWPAVYASDTAERMLERLPAYGINAIALVPYGWRRGDPPRVRLPRGGRSWESEAGIERLARAAQRLGLKVLLKPHLSGRSRLELRTAEERAEWFAEYQAYLEHYARLAARIRADLFSVGAELGPVTAHAVEWRRLIARVREIYSGPLVYAANWGEEFERIEFWDALDYIGVNNYYPLPDSLAAEAVVERIEAVQRRFQRPVIFTEAGFASVEAPHRRPWEEEGRVSLDEQARCYEAVFRAFYHKPWLGGIYWWKVGTNGYGGRAGPLPHALGQAGDGSGEAVVSERRALGERSPTTFTRFVATRANRYSSSRASFTAPSILLSASWWSLPRGG